MKDIIKKIIRIIEHIIMYALFTSGIAFSLLFILGPFLTEPTRDPLTNTQIAIFVSIGVILLITFIYSSCVYTWKLLNDF